MSKYTIAAIVAIFIVFGIFIYISEQKPVALNTSSNTQNTQEVAPNPADMTARQLVDLCTTDMATQFHIHSHVTIMANKQNITIPQNTGIDIQKNCMSSLHTHDTSGVVHIEAPIKKDFTLGDFFYKWGKPLSSTQVLDYQTDMEHALKVYVDGKEVSDPSTIILKDHEEIFIDYYAIKDGPDKIPEAMKWEE